MAFGKPDDFHFDESEEQFDAYLERLEQYFEANDLKDTDEKTKAVFLTIVGKRTHSLWMDLCTPDKPSQKTYKELIDLLKTHYVPRMNFIAERCKFHVRNQLEGESISEYVANLKKLSATCKFGQFLDEALRDRFVCGVKSTELGDRLLTATHSRDLTLALAIEMGLAFEVTVKSSQQFLQKSFKTHVVEKKIGAKPKETVTRPCYRCNGTGHKPEVCRFKDVECRECGKRGHIARACRARLKDKKDVKPARWTKHLDAAAIEDLPNPRPLEAVRSNERPALSTRAHEHERRAGCNVPQPQTDPDTVSERPTNEDCSESAIKGTELFAIDSNVNKLDKPYYVYVRINGLRVKMEVDTGAAVSVISERLYLRRFHKVKLSPASCVLKTYSKESLKLRGKITVKVKCKDETHLLDLMVVKGNGPSLMGRDWISQLNLNWFHVHKLVGETVEQLCDRYSSVFQSELGMLKGIKAKLHVKKGAVPKFCKPRPVPYALRDMVDKELSKLETEGVISPASYSEWAAPIVCIPKKDNSVRICGDYKVTINPGLEVEQYPLPRTQDLFAKLSGGQRFTKLDLSQAYQQVPLEESSKRYLTINTPKGLYTFNRLPYGVASAPAIFQKIMDQVLQGMDGVICYLDDILITGRDTKKHMEALEGVLKRLQAYNLKVRKDKCSFFQTSVSYLGHVIDSEGIHPMKEKTDAIERAPAPTNVSELRSFLALLNCYGKFVPNLSTIIQPMTRLLHKDVEWKWSKECQMAFENSKRHLMSNQVLTHFNAALPLVLACDASPVGVGAVIAHKMSDGSERPIAFASRMLTKTERNYSQIEKEVLGLVFGVMKFHDYLFGRQFILVTDHKPLLKILGPKQGCRPLLPLECRGGL